MRYLQFVWVKTRSLSRMSRTLLSDMRKAWVCLRADRLGLRLTDASTRAMLSGVRTEDGRPGSFLHVREPSSRHCLTHRRNAFGDRASCWFRSRRNPSWVSVMDPVRINSSTTHTHVLLLSSAPRWLNLKVTAHVQIPALRDTLAEKHVTKILKSFTISAASCSMPSRTHTCTTLSPIADVPVRLDRCCCQHLSCCYQTHICVHNITHDTHFPNDWQWITTGAKTVTLKHYRIPLCPSISIRFLEDLQS